MRGLPDCRVRISVLALFLLGAMAPGAASADAPRDLSEGNALKRVDACEAALEHYQAAMTASQPGDGIWEASAYNRGVCQELLGRLDDALATYTLILRRSPSTPAQADALFRRGMTHTLARHPARARADFRRAGARVQDDVSRRRIEVQLGSLDRSAGRRMAAVTRLGDAVLSLRDVVDELPDERWYLAQALVGLGDLHAEEAARGLPRGDLATLTTALGERADALALAQGFYIEAAQQQQPTWTAAATRRLGDAYLALGSRLLELRDAPGRLSAFEQTGLAAWIDGRSPELHRKARDAYRLCADVFTETALDDASTKACRAALDSFPEDRLRRPSAP